MGNIDDLRELQVMRTSWRALVRRWELTTAELDVILPEGGEEQPVIPRDTERRMRLILALRHRLPFADDVREIRAWARAPLAAFAHRTPVDLMCEGPAAVARLRDFAEMRYRP